MWAVCELGLVEKVAQHFSVGVVAVDDQAVGSTGGKDSTETRVESPWDPVGTQCKSGEHRQLHSHRAGASTRGRRGRSTQVGAVVEGAADDAPLKALHYPPDSGKRRA